MGRPAGAANLIGLKTKLSIISVFEALGGAEEMLNWARKNQTDFYKIMVAVLPKDLNVEVSEKPEARVYPLGLPNEQEVTSDHTTH